MTATAQKMGVIFGRSWLIAFAGFLLAGCHQVLREDHAVVYRAAHSTDPYPLVERPAAKALTATLGPLADAKPKIMPKHVLAVCAGGADSPFNAGLLVGWTKSGQRPAFDVVTGTSSGALIGTFAFLGPKYDDRLQVLFTETSSDELFTLRPLRYLIKDRTFASAAPFEKVLQTEINETLLSDLRTAHLQGRRLFIGTTNFDTKRLVVWDIGAIACSGCPDSGLLIRKILLASVTWPAMLAPVEIDVEIDGRRCREQHIDGGATSTAFVRFGPMPGWPDDGKATPGWLAGSNLYVMAGGRLYALPKQVPHKLSSRVFTGTSCLIDSLSRADIRQLHTLCMTTGMRFNLLALPQDYVGEEQSMWKLEKTEMRRLFETGYRITANGPVWRRTPPGAEPGEEEIPRGEHLPTADATSNCRPRLGR